MAQVANLIGTGNYASARYSEFIQRALQEYGRIDYMLAAELDPVSLPKGHTRSYKVIKNRRIPTPMAAATESETPTATALLIDTVSGTTSQYVLVTEFSDVLETIAFHDVLQQAVDEVGDAMARLREWIAADAYIALTNVYYPSTVTARGSLAAANVMDRATWTKASTALRKGLDIKLGAPRPRKDGQFVALVHPDVLEDLKSDAALLNAMTNGMKSEWLESGFIGKLDGVLLKECNHLPIFMNPATGMASLTLTDATAVTDSVPVSGGVSLDGLKVTKTGSGGSLANAVHYLKVVGRHKWKGFPDQISSILTLPTTGAGSSKYTIVAPTDTDYVWDYYIGDTNSNADLFLVTTRNNAAASSLDVTALPTATVPPAHPAVSTAVYMTPVMGAKWGKMVTSSNLQSFITERKSSDSDPAVQRRKVSAKVDFGSFVNEDDFALRIETVS